MKVVQNIKPLQNETTGSLGFHNEVTGRDETLHSYDANTAKGVGELRTSTVPVGSAVALTTATGADVTTIAFTSADIGTEWDVSATVDHSLTGATVTQIACGISATANTMPSQAGGSGIGTDPASIQPSNLVATTGNYTQPIPSVRYKVTAAATLHLVASDTFAAGTIAAFGTLRALRVV